MKLRGSGYRTRVSGLLACLLAVLAVGLVAPQLAAADPGGPNLDSASESVYPPKGEIVMGDPGDNSPANASGDPSGATTIAGLPFTGLSAATMLLVGLLVVIAGLLLRRASAEPD